jgi:hypothetical protein
MEYHKDEIAKALNEVSILTDGVHRMDWVKKYLNKDSDHFTFDEIKPILYKLGYKTRTLNLLKKQLSK